MTDYVNFSLAATIEIPDLMFGNFHAFAEISQAKVAS
jgi:hypothetical protein